VATLREAVARIPDGALLTFGGFDLNRAPMALVLEIIRQRRRGLRIVSVPNPLPLDLLVGAGAVAEAEFGFLGFQYEDGFVVAPSVRRAIEGGTIRWTERDVYEIVQGLRAAALGLPWMPAPGGEGSDYRRVNRTPLVGDPETGGEMPLARAIRPDIALIHAQEADRDGNLRISDPYAEELLARASVRVIATAETLVERLDHPTIPGGAVVAVAAERGGAYPTSCHRHYHVAAAHLRAYLELASAGRVEEYVRRFVTGPADHDAFLAAAGGPGRWEDAGPARGASPAAPAPERAAAADRLVVGMARCLADGEVVATGLASALPMLAIAVARATHAPRLTYVNCVGAVDPAIDTALPTSVDPRLLDRCASTVTLPGLFDMARRGGIGAMFFGASQVDREGRMNLTCIGDYARPRVKLPGPAGSSSMRPFVSKVIITLPRHSGKSLVERVDFVTAAAAPRNRETVVLTDIAILRLSDGRLRLASRHAGVSLEEVRDRTGFPLEGDAEALTPEPAAAEVRALRRIDPAGLRYGFI
jgi:acyl CoA:acetate/3-ketoacid CoA transferase alpha subunit/acyl CoA:acetate/3-ketoacid CoA transferase beta subunit